MDVAELLGHKIQFIGGQSLQFMKVGSTTGEEVLLNLGDPDYVPDEGHFEWHWNTQATLIGAVPYQLMRDDWYWDHDLIIEFDDNGIVKHYEITETKVGVGTKRF